MTHSKRIEINRNAYDFRQQMQVKTPVDLKELVIQLGGSIESTNRDDIDDARIEQNGNSFIIYINNNQDTLRQRFSIAHELGHLILHMNYNLEQKKLLDHNPPGKHFFNRKGNTESEYSANEFAAAFLMPREEFRFCVDQNTGEDQLVDIQEVAKYFQLSVQAVLTRGKFLGIFEW